MRTALMSLSLLALPAVAGDAETEHLSARQLRGCEVELTVTLFHGTQRNLIERARRNFAFENPSCSEQVPIAVMPVKKGDSDVYKVIDKVCGDGKWRYRIAPERRTEPSDLDFDTVTELDVKGCAKASACAPMLEAPAKVSEHPEEPPCKPELFMGNTEAGELVAVEGRKVGRLIRGEGVLEPVKGQPGQFRALHPGAAWYALDKPSQPGGCVQFTVEPNKYKDRSIEAVEYWAYRGFELSKARDRNTIELRNRDRWTIPYEGTVTLHPHDPLVRLGVDDQCRPALVATHLGNGPYFTGAKVAEPNGAAHLLLINETGLELGVPCNVNQFANLEVGEWDRLPKTLNKVSGDELLAVTGEDARAVKPGVAYYMGTDQGSEVCRKLTVVPAPPLADRVAKMKRQLMATTEPVMLKLKVGETHSEPSEATSARGGPHVIDAAMDGKTVRITATRPGYGAVVFKDKSGKERFFFVEVSELR